MNAAIAVMWVLGLTLQTPSAAPRSASCAGALRGGTTGTAAQLCLAEERLRLADAAPKGSDKRAALLQAAASHYRQAVRASKEDSGKVRVLNSLLQLYGVTHLDQPSDAEGVIRELIEIEPNEVTHVLRLAQLQEQQGFLDAAESTLLTARQQHPDHVEPYRSLAQFYARLATALYSAVESQKPVTPTSDPGEPDKDGIYQVGGPLKPPRRMEVPVYPSDAQAAGIKGAVVAEVVINEGGTVVDAKIVQSIPVLDEAALETVRNWRYAPTMVNGQAVPVRMTVTVNFTLP